MRQTWGTEQGMLVNGERERDRQTGKGPGASGEPQPWPGWPLGLASCPGRPAPTPAFGELGLDTHPRSPASPRLTSPGEEGRWGERRSRVETGRLGSHGGVCCPLSPEQEVKTTRKLRQAFGAKSAGKAERRCLDPPTWVSQETCPRREAGSSPTCMPTERAPQVGPSPGHSPGLRAALSWARSRWSPERGLALCQSVWWEGVGSSGPARGPGPPRAWGPAFCSPVLPGNSALGLGAGIRCDVRRA